jgi:hypothetical protein
MGKLKDLWAALPQAKGEEKKEIQEKINSIEQWMIDNKIGNIKEKTNFSKKGDEKRAARTKRLGVKVRDGGVGKLPPGAKTGVARCEACKYNFRSYCDPNDPYGHEAKV